MPLGHRPELRAYKHVFEDRAGRGGAVAEAFRHRAEVTDTEAKRIASRCAT